MITIIDYGLGNISAFQNVYKRLNIASNIATRREDLHGATHIILPGVGSFDHAIELFEASGLKEPIAEIVARGEVFVLGVCVGMQILANRSDEGELTGLGWVGGEVKKLDTIPEMHNKPLPHMGWNDVMVEGNSTLFRGLEESARFYFLHSYYFSCFEARHHIASAFYGRDFTCAVQNGKVYGVQFHPEKSHHWGEILLKNFAGL